MSKNLLTPETENIVLTQRAALFALMANTFQMANAGRSAREIATMSAGILAKLIDGGHMVKDRIEHEVAGMSLKFLHTEQAIIETENILNEDK